MEELMIGSSFILGLTSILAVGVVGISFGLIKSKLNTYGGELNE